MKVRFFCFLISIFLIFSANAETHLAGFDIIPQPQKLKRLVGHLYIDEIVEISFIGGIDDQERMSSLMLHHIINSKVPSKTNRKRIIVRNRLVINTKEAEKLKNEEAYKININSNTITIVAQGAGLFYAVQTLMQIIPESVGSFSLPCVEIEDSPRFSYRGMHLDVSRHFFPVDYIYQFIDLMATYKLNNFHWHLTDDQGWRIEIKKYPKLTEVGGKRAKTLVGNYHDVFPQVFDSIPYSGFYTQEEIRNVVEYAEEHYINVIPEIEIPGHSLSAMASYPELACFPANFKTGEKWGIFEDVYCPGKESTFSFLENVLSEVIALFPSEYIHIGGDECPKTRWEKCENCAKRMRDENLKNTAELQSYFIKRIERFVNSKGKKIIGWDEILEGGLPPNAIVMSWRGNKGGYEAAKQGNYAIMCPSGVLYFDHSEGRSDQEPLSIGGFTNLKEVYNYNPTPNTLSAAEKDRILGVQANTWTEYMETPEKVSYMTLPRMLALSEMAWSTIENKDFEDFSEKRLPIHLRKMERKGLEFRVPTAINAKDTTLFGGYFQFNFRPSVNDAYVYYTVDGYKPDLTSKICTSTIEVFVPVGSQRTVKTMVITKTGKRSAITTTILKNTPQMPSTLINTSDKKRGLRYTSYEGALNSVLGLYEATKIDAGIHTESIRSAKFKNPNRRAFGLRFDGYIYIPKTELYTFSVLSRDGSKLYIDDEVIVDNDGRHSIYEAYGAAKLEKGLHKFKVMYFDGGGGSVLKCFIQEKNEPKTEIPGQLLFCD